MKSYTIPTVTQKLSNKMNAATFSTQKVISKAKSMPTKMQGPMKAKKIPTGTKVTVKKAAPSRISKTMRTKIRKVMSGC